MVTPNIASYLPVLAEKQPDNYAVVQQSLDKTKSAVFETSYTYKQLDEVSDLVARGLQEYGIKKGTRTVLMLEPGLDFFACVFALFKIEAVLVAIDPGMGIKNLGKCLEEAEPEVFIGNKKAHFARIVLGWAKKTIHKTILVDDNIFTKSLITNLNEIKTLGHNNKQEIQETKAEDIAAILFTSGSTGVPKGVVYTHANFSAQVEALKVLYDIQPGDIDLATFPLFALFSPALGMTSVIPKMDFTRPGSVDPAKIIAAINDYECTNMFGSPALINRVGKWAIKRKVKLLSLKRVLSAGAPVAPKAIENFKSLLNSHVQIFTPYGATESLPVSSIGSDELLGETVKLTLSGKGVCVGKPVAGLDVKIIEITDDTIPTWNDDLELPVQQIGEICVQGPQVTRSYFNRSKETALAKIRTKDGFYHRMGDLGYLDEQNRLWFCGRKSQRVITESKTMFTICCEAIFNCHPFVFRSALVGAKNNDETIPVICIELEPEHRKFNKKELTEELLVLASKSDLTKDIKHILFHSRFPVDIRHNAKIGREKLADWATEELF